MEASLVSQSKHNHFFLAAHEAFIQTAVLVLAVSLAFLRLQVGREKLHFEVGLKHLTQRMLSGQHFRNPFIDWKYFLFDDLNRYSFCVSDHPPFFALEDVLKTNANLLHTFILTFVPSNTPTLKFFPSSAITIPFRQFLENYP